MVDHIIMVDELYLQKIPGAKGGMEAVDYATFKSIIQKSHVLPKVIPGGSSANTIRGLANFGHKCALLGKIGSDDISAKFIKNIQALNIVSLYKQSETPIGQIVCLITPDGERTMRSFLGASQELTLEDLDPAAFANVQLVHIEGYTLLKQSLTQKAMELAKSAGAKISFDLGSFELVKTHKKEIIDLIAGYVDIVFANAEEVKSLTGLQPQKACQVLKDLSEIAVILLGAKGCLVGKNNRIIHCPAYPVEALDSTGAGDLFASGFLHGYLEGASLEKCAHYGALAGAAVVQVQGVEILPEIWTEIKARMLLNPSGGSEIEFI